MKKRLRLKLLGQFGLNQPKRRKLFADEEAIETPAKVGNTFSPWRRKLFADEEAIETVY